MLVVSKQRSQRINSQFRHFAEFIQPGDCLVLNDTKVFPARLHGRRNRMDGATVEIFLLHALNTDKSSWRCLVKPAKRLQVGDSVLFDASLKARVTDVGEFGERTMEFESEGTVEDALEEFGEVPLPPYIHRAPGSEDKGRYQTVFARQKGSVAAPTAGLHFTDDVLSQCRARGAAVAKITLHVGLGTFAPLRVKQLSEVVLHDEYFELTEENARLLRGAKRRICVGTTSVRTVETAMMRGGFKAMRGQTNLFIHPGFQFQATDALLTNFHLPESSLLMLVSAFAGYELTMAAYNFAVSERYRFFSYGDCMFVEP